MATYFISDLHLAPARCGVATLFGEFLLAAAADAEAIYILGDLFEYWIGDDAAEAIGQSDPLSAIRELTDAGTPVYFMPGNRDFLVGEGFAETTGCRLLADPTLIDIERNRVLLMHGDSMCLDDLPHQKFRALVNDPQWRRDFLALPVAKRIELAIGARSESAAHKSTVSMEIMDVSQRAVDDAITSHDVDYMIHGHTHRPGIHPVSVGGRDATRIVLGDWDVHSSMLRYNDGEFILSARGRDYPPVAVERAAA